MHKLPGTTTVSRINHGRALAVLAYTVLGVAVVGGLYWAQSVVIPLALGILFATIAAPVVKQVERVGLSRVPAVALFTVVVAAILGGLGWLIFAQTTRLMVDLPKYQENIVAKVDTLAALTRSPSRENWDRLMQELQRTVEQPKPENSSPTPEPAKEVTQPAPAARGDPLWLPGATLVFGLMAQASGYVALAMVVAIFLLVDREDSRNRIIQLIGRGQITLTTKALDDAARRISRFLTIQGLINVSYGFVLALGLSVLGVKYAILWGVLAVVLRYIPYIGGTIAATLPITQALAQFPNWWPALVIIGLVLAMEMIINNFVEPKLFGQSIGVSSVALIMSAAFWTFLWGPVGLIMAGPLTVCLAVLGKYVPPLRFLNVLLGDQEPLEKSVILYQRLLAKDETETERMMGDALEHQTLAQVYDTLVFPAAINAGMDRESGLLSSEEEQYVYDELDEIMSNNVSPATASPANENPRPARLLLIAARDMGDGLGVAALMNTLDPGEYHLVQASGSMTKGEVLTLAEQEKVDGICISSLPPGGLSHTKHLCKRIRATLPHVRIFVGNWIGSDGEKAGWSELDADAVVYSLQDMLKQLDGWKPVMEASGKAFQSDHEGAASLKPHIGITSRLRP